MVDRIKGFVEVQEEHSTGTPLINIWKNMVKEFNYARASGVALPEPRLSFWEDMVTGQVGVNLVVDLVL